MLANEINKITESDLQSLIANAVSEGKTIEYKQLLQISQDNERKEFLADVSSFANASGGDLIIGISENSGNPVELLGIEIDDEGLRRVDSIIREGINPRLPSVVIQPIKLANSRTVLVIRVGRSWLSPHRVDFKGHDKFFSRSTNGKYPLDVSELRTAFTLSETLTDEIRRFREDRIAKISASETPVLFGGNSKIVLHLIPLASLKPGEKYDIDKIVAQPELLRPIYCGSWNHRYNLDGFVTYSGTETIESHSYVQLYRRGIIEAVESGILGAKQEDRKIIPSAYFEAELIASLKKYIQVMSALRIDPPVILFLTLVNVKGYFMAEPPALWNPFYGSHSIDRDILMLPDVMIENYADEADHILRSCFDAIWNACGMRGSIFYDSNGRWQRKN
jgi:hypothetical protein